MPWSRGATAVAGKAGYAIGCLVAVLAMAVSGFGYYVTTSVASIGGSTAISGGASVGAMNILLMGLESRTYWSGQPLPRGLEDAMHIGSVGGQATNTLIVIHIFAGGQKAAGFSIPRDDWVTYPQAYDGQAQGKIDQAYGFALAEKEQSLAGKGLTQAQIGYLGNEAGRKAEIATVQELTGVKIDHFAELNLLGFYQLAKVFGGIEVCLNQRAYDPDYSGANIVPGYHLLAPAQALAFVRQRHNLTNGDLDRTHRQQAVIDYVLWKLRSQGALNDLAQLGSLLTVARQYLVTDKGWNLLDFLPEMEALSGNSLTFKTLPIAGYATIDGQSANVVNTTKIKHLVHVAFYPAPTPTASATASQSQGALSVSASLDAGTGTPSQSPTASATATSGPEGAAVTVKPNAPYGIPCVD